MTKRERVQGQIDRTKNLYATGPLSPVFFQWVDQTLTVLRAVFGADSEEVRDFLEAAGEDVHDPNSVMLPVHTEWGTHARMKRCIASLERALAKLPAGDRAPSR